MDRRFARRRNHAASPPNFEVNIVILQLKRESTEPDKTARQSPVPVTLVRSARTVSADTGVAASPPAIADIGDDGGDLPVIPRTCCIRPLMVRSRLRASRTMRPVAHPSRRTPVRALRDEGWSYRPIFAPLNFVGLAFTGSSSDQSPSGNTCPFGNGARSSSPSERSTRSSR